MKPCGCKIQMQILSVSFTWVQPPWIRSCNYADYFSVSYELFNSSLSNVIDWFPAFVAPIHRIEVDGQKYLSHLILLHMVLVVIWI